MTDATTKNLYQRIATVIGSIGELKPNGTNQQGKPALSIGDVESAISPYLASVGIAIIPSVISLESFSRPTSTGREMELWRITISFTVVNADTPKEFISIEWSDIGGNPAAASSFARKSFYKALFHLAEDDDAGTSEEHQKRPAKKAEVASEPTAADFVSSGPCPICASNEWKSKKGRTAELISYRGGPVKCSGVNDSGEPIRHTVADVSKFNDVQASNDVAVEEIPF